jgi:O-antigen ligase
MNSFILLYRGWASSQKGKVMGRSKIVLALTVALLFFHLTSSLLIANAMIGLLLLTVFIDRNIGSKLKILASSRDWFVLISLFLTFAVSAFYSEETMQAWKIIELRLPLLLFPLVYGLAPMTVKQKELTFKFFIGLVSILPLIGMLTQWNTYLETGDSGWFYSDNIVQYVGKQAVYFAMYINFAVVGLFYFWYTDKLTYPLEKVGAVLVLVFLVVNQYLLASRTSILTMALLIGGFVVLLIVTKINRKQTLALLVGLLFFVFGLIVLFPKVLKRFDSITHVEFQFENTNPINHFNGKIKKENWNGLNTRIALWTCAVDEIKKRPIVGSGIGDVQDDLIKNYTSKNFYFAINSNYNCHNQYLDVLLSNGIVGFGVFLFFLSYLLIKSIKDKNGILFGIVFVFSLACLTENVLGRNQGVVLMSLLISMLTLSKVNVNLSDKA